MSKLSSKIRDWITSVPVGGSPLKEVEEADDERQSSPKSPAQGDSSISALDLEAAGNNSPEGSSNPNSQSLTQISEEEEDSGQQQEEEAQKTPLTIAERPFPDFNPLDFNDENVS